MLDIRTLHQHVCSKSKDVLQWPPDVFGFCAYLAKLTGIYTVYAEKPEWVHKVGEEAVRDGALWRNAIDDRSSALPKPIEAAWGLVCRYLGKTKGSLSTEKKFVRAVLYLLAAADEACVGVGIPSDGGRPTWFELVSETHLSFYGNLCRELPQDVIRVLPKLHTPQSGLNIRSLSHHLSLCSASEVQTKWAQSPLVENTGERCAFNVLLAPWPLEINASAFKPAAIKSKNSEHFGYVDFRPGNATRSLSVQNWLGRLLKRAGDIGQKIDLVVFPECALNDRQWDSVSSLCKEYGVALVGGVHSKPKNSKRALNSVRFALPLIDEQLIQYKHHRWQINDTQIQSYSLGGSLKTSKLWWENIEIRERLLHFLSVDQDLTLCTLICEDLARQDPVAEIVRAVGPNLVIALLMDGPQINGRWSSRYASVLADDPGSSVITLSSLGMVERSRPNGFAASRTVASWKDAFGSFVPFELKGGEDAIILNLQLKTKKEWTVDGRNDGEVATFPVLCGTHVISSGVSI